MAEEYPGRAVARYLMDGPKQWGLFGLVILAWFGAVVGPALVVAGLHLLSVAVAAGGTFAFGFGALLAKESALRLGEGFAVSPMAGSRPRYGQKRLRVLVWLPFWMLTVSSLFLAMAELGL